MMLSPHVLRAVAELAARGVLREDGAFETAHPRDEQGQFAAKSSSDQGQQKQDPKKAKVKAKAKKRRPSLANVRGHELEWAQRLGVESAFQDSPYEDHYGTLTNEFGDLTGIWTEKGRRKFSYRASNQRLSTIMGKDFQVEHAEDPHVQKIIADLAMIPTPVLMALHDSGVKIKIGTRPLNTYSEYVWGADQKSWDGRPLASVPAFYSPEAKVALVNAPLCNADTMLHELGHAVDLTATHISSDPEFLAIQQAEAPSLGNDYYYDPAHPEESAREFAAESLNRAWRRVPTGPRTDAYLQGHGYAPRSKARKRVA